MVAEETSQGQIPLFTCSCCTLKIKDACIWVFNSIFKNFFSGEKVNFIILIPNNTNSLV